MIIISGYIDLDPQRMDAALKKAVPLIEGALDEQGCLDYDWCPNPLIAGRVRVFERWTDEESLAAHFQSRWYKEMGETLVEAGMQGVEVLKYQADISEPVYDEGGNPRADFFTQK
ncbi:MAG: putative quinol monooxygenase [Spongiibacteraceae bacterium]